MAFVLPQRPIHRKGKRRGPVKRARQRDKRHLATLARLPCVISGSTEVHVAHIRYADSRYGKPETGIGNKPDDQWSLPLAPRLHTDSNEAQHQMGEREFWERHGIDATALANELHSVWGRANDPIEAEEMMRLIIARDRRLR